MQTNQHTTAMASRLQEVFLDGTWIANTNYKDQIQKVNWEQAIQKIENLNSIAALTYHINYYLAGLLDAFDSGELKISDKYSFDLPPVNDAADWDLLVFKFLSNAEQFCKCIAMMTDDMLQKPFIDEKYGTYQRNIEGVIEHSYYHLGQITLINKLLQK
ncbi:DinB family protein [Flavobacterium pallidum]|uniref:DUF1572 domain-containing protein n=1 Tax=Flavobacterium pallidum TaxID=2172098 RepID=A0A2S1SJ83_9FLAO|nr:DinB family protein [Flavobacterium pallidum]AWI26463.1 DUF1572 domain-containing protein [Flavobacterium pallidum]